MELFEQAQALHAEGKLEEAEKLYDQLLTQNHANAGLLATMGTLYLSMGRLGLAISLLESSLEKTKGKRRTSDVLCNLGIAYKQAGLKDKAYNYLKEACNDDLDPSAQALTNYGSLFIEHEDRDIGKKALEKAIAMRPEMALAHWNYALILLSEGKWDTAWDEQEYGFDCGMRVKRKFGDLPYWDGTPGKTVIVHGEQGIGDEIMFASMLPDMLKENRVIFESHRRLQTLFSNSFRIPVFGTREDEEAHWFGHQKADAVCSIGTLGKFYRRNKEAFPGTSYLTTQEIPQGDKFRVGISWSGGHKATRVQKRSVPLSWWKTILNVPEVEFISLQYTDCADEIRMVNDDGYNIKQFDAVKAEDYNETAKLVKSCDLVISVCTSVIHLAGALGVPTWVMTPHAPAWRYGFQGPMPWYRSVRLYRQPNGDADAWIPVVQKVGLDLSELMDSKRQKAA